LAHRRTGAPSAILAVFANPFAKGKVMADTVRFTELLKHGGKPQVYLPFTDPRADRNFQKLVRAHRVLTIKQTPTGTQKDHGTIGALFEKYVTYLIFPKSLEQYAERRVVGIRYDQLKGTPSVLPPVTPQVAKSSAAGPRAQKAKVMTKPKPIPEVKVFDVQLRLTATKNVNVRVSASTLRKARAEALQKVSGEKDFSDAEISVTVRKIGRVRN
jgi:hypothetical protein